MSRKARIILLGELCGLGGFYSQRDGQDTAGY